MPNKDKNIQFYRPSLLDSASGDLHRQLRLAQIIALVLGVLLLVRAIDWQITSRIISLSILVICVLTSIGLSRGHKVGAAIHVLLAGYLESVVVGTATSGGLQNVVVGWLLLVPSISALLGGKKYFILWTLAALTALLGLMVLNGLGYANENLTPEPYRAAQDYIHVVGQFCLLSATLYAFFSQFEFYESEIAHHISEVEREVQTRKRAESIAVASNQAKTRFLANMSHQLRTPLNSIIGFSRRLLHRDIGFGERDKNALDSIHRNGKTLLKIVNGLIELAQLDSEDLSFNWQPCDLAEAVRVEVDVCAQELIQFSERDVILGDCEPFPMIGDPVKISQIFHNILDYFIRHTQANSVLVTCASNQKNDAWGSVDFRIINSGISAEFLKGMFDLDFGLNLQETVDSTLGGVGLAIASRLILLHQGSVKITAISPDELNVQVSLSSVPDSYPEG